MGEHFANIYPLDQLRRWHILVATCARCAHREVLRLPEVRAQHPEMVYIYEIEPWLACTRCGNRERNRISVDKLPR